MWAVGETTHSLISKMLWELLPDLTLRRGVRSRRRRQLWSINELIQAGGVILTVFFTFLINSTGLRQMALLAHMINDLQVSVDLLGRWQTHLRGASTDLHIKVFLFRSNSQVFISNRDLFPSNCCSIIVNPFVVDSVEVALDIVETSFAFLSLRRTERIVPGISTIISRTLAEAFLQRLRSLSVMQFLLLIIRDNALAI